MSNITLEALPDRICCAQEQELDGVCKALTERFSEIHPEWELLILSVHGHDAQSHIDVLQASMDFFQNQK